MHEIDPRLDREIDGRLAALAARAPGGDPPVPVTAGRRRGFAVSLAVAPALVLAMVATVAGGVVVANLTGAHPGIENPGQPLAGARMECMSPPQAAAFLAAHGHSAVVWQVESGSAANKTTSTVIAATPPEHGYVVPGAVADDGLLHMVVDQREGATGVGACYGMPMP